jgi:restriction endonuclease Mrr
MYTKGNVKKIDLWKGQVRSVEHQLPTEGTEEADILQALTQLHHTRFEAAIVSMFRSMTSLVHTIHRTTPTADGGFDFYGEFVMPRPLSYRISFLGEVKRYGRGTPVGPGDVSRLVARLGRGEYGLFVTTSYFTKQAQQEVLADAYPVKLIAGVDLVNFLKELRLISGTELRASWLTAMDDELDIVLSKR